MWKPIETAPKDGTLIDVFNGERRANVSWTRPDGGSWDFKDWCQMQPFFEGCNVGWCQEVIEPPPTHWQPLPDPPAD